LCGLHPSSEQQNTVLKCKPWWIAEVYTELSYQKDEVSPYAKTVGPGPDFPRHQSMYRSHGGWIIIEDRDYSDILTGTRPRSSHLIVWLSFVQNSPYPEPEAFHSQERCHRNHPKPTNNSSHHSQGNPMLGRKRSANLPSKLIPPVLRDLCAVCCILLYSG
jgi:hypothetical protein